MGATIPIACTLTKDEMPARREMFRKMGGAVEETVEREDGFAYRFASDERLPDLAAVIQAERRCCPFLRFVVTCEPGNGPVWLEVTGPAGTKEIIKSFFH